MIFCSNEKKRKTIQNEDTLHFIRNLESNQAFFLIFRFDLSKDFYLSVGL